MSHSFPFQVLCCTCLSSTWLSCSIWSPAKHDKPIPFITTSSSNHSSIHLLLNKWLLRAKRGPGEKGLLPFQSLWSRPCEAGDNSREPCVASCLACIKFRTASIYDGVIHLKPVPQGSTICPCEPLDRDTGSQLTRLSKSVPLDLVMRAASPTLTC